MKRKKILIMGSDFGSIDLAKAAKKRGMYVIVADLMETSPTKQMADETWMINIRDVNALEKKCKEVGIHYAIVGANDFNITAYRELCKRLKLPMYCENDISWAASTNKRIFKDVAISVGARVAKDYILSNCPTYKELQEIVYPVVIKPIDSQGNQGMSYCNNNEELLIAIQHAKNVSMSGKFICERKLHGPEFAVNYIIADGKIQLLYFSSEHIQPGAPENNYSLIMVTPGYLKQYLEEMNDKVIQILKMLGCIDGIAWVETILDTDGHFYLLEMGHRFGGEMIYSTYSRVINFDIVGYVLDTAMGIKHTKYDLPPALTPANISTAASYHLFTKKSGMITIIEGLNEIENLPNAIVDIPRREGNIILEQGQMGVIRLYGENCKEICDTIQYINSILKIKNADGDNMFIYFNDFTSVMDEYKKGLNGFGLS